MRSKITLIAILVITCFSLKAQQQIPNGNFQSWTSPLVPDDWNDLDTLYQLATNYFTFKDTIDYYPASPSVELISDTLPGSNGQILDGILSLGTLSIANSQIQFVEIPFTSRPDSLLYYYKYGSLEPDTPAVAIEMINGTDTVFNETFTLQPDSVWVQGYVFLDPYYINEGTADSLEILFSVSSGSFNGRPALLGSKLHLDGVRFGYVYPGVGIADVKNQIALNVYPNPASNELNITSDKDLTDSKFQLFDIAGKLMVTQALQGISNTVNVSNLINGTYIYRITDKDQNVLDQNKVNVIR